MMPADRWTAAKATHGASIADALLAYHDPSTQSLDNLLCGDDSRRVFATAAYFSKTSVVDIFDVKDGVGTLLAYVGDEQLSASIVVGEPLLVDSTLVLEYAVLLARADAETTGR